MDIKEIKLNLITWYGYKMEREIKKMRNKEIIKLNYKSG
jgi:hypothetical protein